MAEVEELSTGEFVAALTISALTEDEVVQWIRANRPTGQDEVDVMTALGKQQGGITDPIRNALRFAKGLPPLPA